MKTVWKHENDSYILHMPNAKLKIFLTYGILIHIHHGNGL